MSVLSHKMETVTITHWAEIKQMVVYRLCGDIVYARRHRMNAGPSNLLHFINL